MIREYEIRIKNREILPALLRIFWRGNENEKLEEYFSKLFGRKALGVGSGSDAIFVILKEIEKKYGKGEVICSNYSCKSIPRAIIKAGFEPVFVDADKSLSLDIRMVKKATSSKTRAILVYHPFGFPHNQDIFYYCKRNKILCIEDCAKGFGFYANGKRIGSRGDYSFFSFRTGKLLHSGSGSIIISKTKITIQLKPYPKILSLINIFDLLLRKIINLPKPKAVFDYFLDRIGAVKIGGAEAYLTLKQLTFINNFGGKRRKNYDEISKAIGRTKFMAINFNKGKTIPLSFPVLVNKRRLFLKILRDFKIEARAYYAHVNNEEFNNYKSFLNGTSKNISKRIVNIPVHEYLTEYELFKIGIAIKNADNKINR